MADVYVPTTWRRTFVAALCLERQKASADNFWIQNTLFSVLQFFFVLFNDADDW